MVESFSANDQVIYVVNENFRDPNKPYFDRVLLKGGGDAEAAARATIQTGESITAGTSASSPNCFGVWRMKIIRASS